MMMKQVSPKDWQLLSAYLDGQLSQPKREKLEARLAQDESLQKGLLELRQTRYLLKKARPLKAPRNFTLSPELAAEIRPARKPFTIPLLSISSIAAALLMVFVILLEVVPGAFSPMSMAEAPASEMLAMEAAPEMDMRAAAPEDAPPIIQWGGPPGTGGGGDPYLAEGMGGGPGIGGAAPDTGKAPVMEPTTEEPVAPIVPPDVSGGGAEATQEPAQEESEQIRGAGPILGIRPADEAQAYNQAVLNILAEEELEADYGQSGTLPYLRMIQIALGIIALSTAIAAVWLSRKATF